MSNTMGGGEFIIIQTKTITSVNYIKKSTDKTITSNSFIGYLSQTKTINSNARIKKLATTKTLNSNSKIKQVYTKTINSNAFLGYPAQTKTIISNSYIRKLDNDKIINSNFYVKKLGIVKTINLNYQLKKLATDKTITSDSNIKKLATDKTITSDLYIQKLNNKTLISDSCIKKLAIEKSLISDSCIKKPGTEGSINSNAFIGYTSQTKTVKSDSYIKKLNDKTINSNAYIKKTDNVKTILLDMFLGYVGQTKTINSNFVLKKLANETTVNSNCFIKQTYPKTIVSDLFIIKLASKTINSDFYVKKLAASNTISSNAYIKESGSEGSITSNMFIGYLAQTKVIIANSKIKILGTTKTITCDAWLVHDKVIPRGNQRSMWFDGTRWWRSIYNYTNARIEFWYTTDKVTWTENTNARIVANAWSYMFDLLVRSADFSTIQTRGNDYLFIAYKDNAADVLARRAGTGYPGTTWAWSAATTVLDGSADSGEYRRVNIGKRRDTRLCIVAQLKLDTGNRNIVAIRGSNNNSIAVWTGKVTLSNNSAVGNMSASIRESGKAPADNCTVVYNEGTTLFSRFWNGTTWAVAETVGTLNTLYTTNYRYNWGMSVKRLEISDPVVMYINATGDLVFRENTNIQVAGNWQAEQTVSPAAVDEEYMYATISESGNIPGRFFVGVIEGNYPTRRIEFYRSGATPYTSWMEQVTFNTGNYTSAQALNIIDNSASTAGTAMGFTYQYDTGIESTFFTGLYTLDSDSKIKKLGTSNTINSNYKIKSLGTTKTINSNAKIKKLAIEKSLNSNYRLKQLGITKTINSNSQIKATATKTILSDAYVVHDKIIPMGFQRSTWYDGIRYWRSLYNYTDSRIEFWYTSNLGATWTENTAARLTANAFNIEWGHKTADYNICDKDFTNFYITYKDGDDIYARSSSTEEGYPSTFWYWSDPVLVLDGSADSGTYNFVSMCNRKGNKLAVSAVLNKTGVGRQVECILASTANSIITWAGQTTISNTGLGVATYSSLRKAHDNNDELYVVWNESTSLLGRFYDGDWAAAVETIATLNSAISTDWRVTWGLESVRDTYNSEHIVYINANGDLCHRYNLDAGTPDNWGAEVIVSAVNGFLYPCISESGIATGRVYIASTHGAHPNRHVDIDWANSDYSTWTAQHNWDSIDAQALGILDSFGSTTTAIAYTYQDNTGIQTIFFAMAARLNSNMFLGYLAQTKTINSNAVIKKPGAEGSIYSNYKIKQTYTKTVSLNYYIKQSSSGTINSDMFLGYFGQTKTIICNANIKQIGTSTINSNSYIKQSYSKTINSNSQIKKPGTEGSITSDMFLGYIQSKSVISNYLIKKLAAAKIINSDSYIKRLDNINTINSDYRVIRVGIPNTINSDMFLGYTGQTKTISSNAQIKKLGYEGSLISNYNIKKLAIETTLSSDSYIQKIDNFNIIITNSNLKAISAAALVSDYYIKKLSVVNTINSDYYIKKLAESFISLDYYIKKLGRENTISSDALVKGPYTKSINSNYNIKKEAYEGSISAVYYVKKLDNIKTINTNYYIQKADNIITINTNSNLKAAISKNITSDYYIKELGHVSTINTNYYIKKLDNNRTINSNYYLLKLIEGSILSDSYIKAVYTKTIQTNSIVKASSVATIASNAYLKKLDNIKTINTNYYIQKADTKNLNSNYNIKVTYLKSISLNYKIKKLGEPVIINSNSYIKKLDNVTTISTDYTIRTIGTKTLISNYHIKKSPYQSSFNSNYYISKPAATVTINSNSNIVRITKGILISPTDVSKVSDSYVNFVFYQSESYVGNLHAQIQISRNVGFTDIEINEYSFNPVLGTWQYYNGAAWVGYPVAGLSYSANLQIRVRFDLLSGTKYWRIRGLVK